MVQLLRLFLVSFFWFTYLISTPVNFTQSLAAVKDIEELTLIANILYWSYERALANIRVKEAHLTLIRYSWQLLDSLTRARSNPVLEQTLQTDTDILISHAKAIKTAVDHFRSVGNIYHMGIKKVVRDTANRPTATKVYLTLMQDRARRAVARSLAHEIKQFKPLLLQTAQTVLPFITQYRLFGTKKLIHSVKEFLPKLATGSFMALDAHYSSLSQKQWQKFYATQEASYRIWQAIESARAQFYYERYKELALYLKTINIASLPVAINQEGVIPPDNRTTKLPFPEDMVSSLQKGSTQ